MTHKDRWLLWLFLAPTLVLMAAFLYYPMIGTVFESFRDTSFINPTPRFVGFEIYEKILDSRDFYEILRNSIIWTLGVVILQNLL